MPPSAGACQTTDAAENPDCGRAAPRSSIMTAIGWRAATWGRTRRPVSGAGTVVGVGTGVGVGVRLALGTRLGLDGGLPAKPRFDGGAVDGPTELTAPTGCWPPVARTTPRPKPPAAARPRTPNVAARLI